MDLPTPGAVARFDFGVPIGSLAAGRYLTDRWRVELEAAYRENDLETLFWPGADGETRISASDGVRAVSGQLNVIRDFRIGAFQPYAGLGIGAARLHYRFSEVRTTGPGTTARDPLLDDVTWTPAGQLIGGFRVPVSRKLELAFDYRYWRALSSGVRAADGRALDLGHTVHSGFVHLRYLTRGAWPHEAEAAPSRPGWSLGLALGSGYAMDAEIEDSLANLDAFRVGPVVTVSVGYDFTPRWRVALEASRRSNRVEVVDFNPEAGQASASGKVEADSLTLSALYRFRPNRSTRPFLGAGAGASRSRYRIVTQGESYVDDRSGISPVVQLQAGLDIALNRRLDFTAYFQTWYSYPVKMDRPDGTPFQTSHWVHSLNLGVRYGF